MRRCNGDADSTYLELVLASLRLGLGVKKIDRENLFIDIRKKDNRLENTKKTRKMNKTWEIDPRDIGRDELGQTVKVVKMFVACFSLVCWSLTLGFAGCQQTSKGHGYIRAAFYPFCSGITTRSKATYMA
ncbi:hypothetical protein H109_05080 [Trichophyton interdigitale MR816]|uniref:Uncharacterized protein n=1 Tax=Trichophyton interdigitale (strain MR816) TaxID=1215338 RepID=A0A059J5I0_TRIIM|nr:hypothetical protein H109_05080 [Trichophyton interdigitale MR816]